MSRLRPTTAPEEAFRQRLRVRSYEVGQDGRLRAGNLLRYLEWIATEASAALGFTADWYVKRGTAWVVREMDLFLGELPPVAAEIELATWVADFKRVQALREYAVWCARTGTLVARAHARWAYVDRARGLPQRLPEELSEAFRPLGHAMDVRPRMSGPSDWPSSELELTAREYEADSQMHINNCVYADWLSEAFNRATSASAWSKDKHPSPRYLHIEYARPALPATRIRIATQVRHSGSRRLNVEQVVTDGEMGHVHVRGSSEYLLLPIRDQAT